MKLPKADCTEPKGTFGSWNMETKKSFMRFISEHSEWLIQANMQLYGILPMKHWPVYQDEKWGDRTMVDGEFRVLRIRFALNR